MQSQPASPAAPRAIRRPVLAALVVGAILLLLAGYSYVSIQQVGHLKTQRELLQENLSRLDRQADELVKGSSAIETGYDRVTHFSQDFARKRWTEALRAIARGEDAQFSNVDHRSTDVAVRSAIEARVEGILLNTMRISEKKDQPGIYEFFMSCVSTGARPRLLADHFTSAIQASLEKQFTVSKGAEFLNLVDLNRPKGYIPQATFDVILNLDLNTPNPPAKP